MGRTEYSATVGLLFQSYRVANPVAGASVEGNPVTLTLTVGQPGADGRVPLTATLMENGQAISGAKVAAGDREVGVCCLNSGARLCRESIVGPRLPPTDI